MLKSLTLCLAILSLSAQSDLQGLNIERTEVYSDYGSIYILMLANKLIPPDKISTRKDIDCLIREARASGVFTEVRSRLVLQKQANVLKLTATTIPLNSVVISKIDLVGFSNIDPSKFQQSLKNNGVNAGDLLLKYSLNELMQRIAKSFEDVSENASDMEIPWIGIRPDGAAKIRFIVSPSYEDVQ